jgi:hypothetical protein
MSNASALFRSLLVYGLCLPLAVALGYLLATPLDLYTMTAVGMVLLLLLTPLLLRWHHVWLIVAWNMSAGLFFLPGRPPLWEALAGISFGIGLLQYAINRDTKFLNVSSVTRPLLFLLVIVLVTAYLTGGIGLRAFGSQTYGGKNYVSIFAAVLGYFALTTRQIPPKRAGLYLTLFFLGTASAAIGELPRVLPATFNAIFWIFPITTSDVMLEQSTSVAGGLGEFTRINGLSMLGLGCFYAMLVRYGIRGILLEPGKPWRLLMLAASFLVGLWGGFRSALLLMVAVFVVLFFMERLHRTRLLPILLFAAVVGGSLMVAFASRLPFYVQRSLAFLPIDIDPMARLSAQASTDWRLKMWQEVLPLVPEYFWIGKGYGFNANEMNILQHNDTSGGSLASTELAGDYHNGPLSLMIPFGVFGTIGFLWFLWASIRLLYNNYHFGDPAYRTFNGFLFSWFAVKAVFFFVIFGGFAGDLMMFTGVVGLSVSLNGGMAKPAVAPQPAVVFNRFHSGLRRPIGA